MRNKLIFIIISIIYFSCSKEVEIDIPRVEPKLVVNSFFSPDSLLKLHVSKSNHILDIAENNIENAEVNLYANGMFVESLLNKENGFYQTLTYLPQPEISYEVNILANGYNNVSANDYIPSAVEIKSLDITENVGENLYDGYYSRLEMEFTDPVQTNNYYELILTYRLTDTLIGEDSIFNNLFRNGIARCFSNDPVVKDEGIYDENSSHASLLFKDDLINGKNYKLNVNYFTTPDPDVETRKYTLYIQFNSISETYYNFRKKIIIKSQSSGGELWETGEPVQLFSNIENGYGIFAGYSASIDSISNK